MYFHTHVAWRPNTESQKPFSVFGNSITKERWFKFSTLPLHPNFLLIMDTPQPRSGNSGKEVSARENPDALDNLRKLISPRQGVIIKKWVELRHSAAPEMREVRKWAINAATENIIYGQIDGHGKKWRRNKRNSCVLACSFQGCFRKIRMCMKREKVVREPVWYCVIKRLHMQATATLRMPPRDKSKVSRLLCWFLSRLSAFLVTSAIAISVFLNHSSASFP